MNSQEHFCILHEIPLTLQQKVGVTTFQKNVMALAEHRNVLKSGFYNIRAFFMCYLSHPEIMAHPIKAIT